jgi:hypothetical protein
MLYKMGKLLVINFNPYKKETAWAYKMKKNRGKIQGKWASERFTCSENLKEKKKNHTTHRN